MISRCAAVGVLVLATCLSPAAAEAQGRGRPKTPKPVETPSGSTAAGSTPPTAGTITSAATFRQFGSWLDDTSALGRGDGYTSVAIGHWRMAGMTQTDVPMLGAAVGLSDRIQVNASVPFYRLNFQGTTFTGMDDVYVGAKYTVIDPTLTLSEFGLAVSPVVEILSEGAPDRVHFAIPVSVELRRAPFRAYGSIGYFTRGSVFTGGAMEWNSAGGLTLTGAVTQSYSTSDDTALDRVGIGKHRVDVTAAVAYPFSSRVGASMSVGRSLTSIEEGGASLVITAGLSVRFSATRSNP